MITKFFKQWAEANTELLHSDFISTEIIEKTQLNGKRVADPSVVVLHEAAYCLGEIIVWESAQLEYQVVKIQTEERLLWNYIDKLSENPNFDEITTEYFKVLNSGLKP